GRAARVGTLHPYDLRHHAPVGRGARDLRSREGRPAPVRRGGGVRQPPLSSRCRRSPRPGSPSPVRQKLHSEETTMRARGIMALGSGIGPWVAGSVAMRLVIVGTYLGQALLMAGILSQ